MKYHRSAKKNKDAAPLDYCVIGLYASAHCQIRWRFRGSEYFALSYWLVYTMYRSLMLLL